MPTRDTHATTATEVAELDESQEVPQPAGCPNLRDPPVLEWLRRGERSFGEHSLVDDSQANEGSPTDLSSVEGNSCPPADLSSVEGSATGSMIAQHCDVDEGVLDTTGGGLDFSQCGARLVFKLVYDKSSRRFVAKGYPFEPDVLPYQ